jgi:DNA-directed RNA polymerase specialized sigma24 family protein
MALIAKDVKPLTEEQKKLVEDNINLTDWFLKRTLKSIYVNDKEGFRQELMLALVKSASTYDKTKGSFTTHATWQMRSAVSLWMHNKKKTSGTMFIEDCYATDDEESASGLVPDPKTTDDINIKLEKFREMLFAMPIEDRVCLPQARFIFSDYDPSLEFNGTNAENVRIDMEAKVALNIIRSYQNLVI